MPDALRIAGGLVVTGEGGEQGLEVDLLVRDGKIVDIIRPDVVTPGYQELDAGGCWVTPGFIDIHSHSDLTWLASPTSQSRTRQGITTEVSGNCGMTPYPVGGDVKTLRDAIATIDLIASVDIAWTSFAGYSAVAAGHRSTVNIAPMIGHGSIWLASAEAGSDDVPAITKAVDHLTDAARSGVWGLSFGLAYPPAVNSSSESLTALAWKAAELELMISAHLRDYSAAELVASVQEMIDITPHGNLQISHLRGRYPTDTDYLRSTLDKLQGNVGADVYPYTSGMTTLLLLFSPKYRQGGLSSFLEVAQHSPERLVADLENSQFAARDVTIAKVGQSAHDLAGVDFEYASRSLGTSWGALAVDLMRVHRGVVDVMVDGSRESHVRLTAGHPSVLIASDGFTLDDTYSAGAVHPRTTDTFPRALRWLLDDGMPVEDAIAKMTSQAARKVGLRRRGALAPGAVADIVLIDRSCFDRDRSASPPATRTAGAGPGQAPRDGEPAGIKHVLVSGDLVLRYGKTTGRRPGRLLLRDH